MAIKLWGQGIPSRTVKYAIPERWEEFARTMTQAQACEHFKVSKNVVRRWQQITGYRCKAYRGLVPNYPPSFAATAHERTAAEWAEVCGFPAQTIRQWARDLGVKCKPVPPGNKKGYVPKVGRW